MLEQLQQLRVVPPHPLRLPSHLEQLEPGHQVSVHVLEVEGISPVFRDVLHDAVDVVEGVASVGIVLAEFLTIYHVEVRLLFGVSVDPDVNKGIDLLNRVFPESGS